MLQQFLDAVEHLGDSIFFILEQRFEMHVPAAFLIRLIEVLEVLIRLEAFVIDSLNQRLLVALGVMVNDMPEER